MDLILIDWEDIYRDLDVLIQETSEEGWDEERGVPIERDQWEKVRLFMKDVQRNLPHIRAPFVSACGDGCIHLEWCKFSNSARAVVEVCKEGRQYFTELLSNPIEVTDLPTLDDAIAKLQRFLDPQGSSIPQSQD